MKKNSNIVKSAKVTNVISACIMVLSGALLLFLPDMERITAQRILLFRRQQILQQARAV